MTTTDKTTHGVALYTLTDLIRDCPPVKAIADAGIIESLEITFDSSIHNRADLPRITARILPKKSS